MKNEISKRNVSIKKKRNKKAKGFVFAKGNTFLQQKTSRRKSFQKGLFAELCLDNIILRKKNILLQFFPWGAGGSAPPTPPRPQPGPGPGHPRPGRPMIAVASDCVQRSFVYLLRENTFVTIFFANNIFLYIWLSCVRFFDIYLFDNGFFS